MIGTKIYKENFDSKEYANAAQWCNENNATIADVGPYYEVIALPEEPEPTLEELKAIKLSEVDAWTESKITGGFISECTGEIVRYDSDKDTQLTVSSDLNTINSALDKFSEHYPEGYPMRGYPEGRLDKSVYYLSVEQLIKWNVDLGLHRGKCKQQGWEKQAEVAAALSKEDLDAIILN